MCLNNWSSNNLRVNTTSKFKKIYYVILIICWGENEFIIVFGFQLLLLLIVEFFNQINNIRIERRINHNGIELRYSLGVVIM